MVDQNGGKFECLQKIIKRLRFIQIEKFFRRSSLGEMQNSMSEKNFLTLWAL